MLTSVYIPYNPIVSYRSSSIYLPMTILTMRVFLSVQTTARMPATTLLMSAYLSQNSPKYDGPGFRCVSANVCPSIAMKSAKRLPIMSIYSLRDYSANTAKRLPIMSIYSLRDYSANVCLPAMMSIYSSRNWDYTASHLLGGWYFLGTSNITIMIEYSRFVTIRAFNRILGIHVA
jgi:hypothetical protein